MASYPHHRNRVDEPRPRPLSSASSVRPLSIASTTNSIASSSSSFTGGRRRRSAILLELELGSDPLDDTPAKQSIRNSILRAEEVLRASERQRELERRKDRADLRTRQIVQSMHFVEHFADTTEELNERMEDQQDRFSPRRLLRKAQSIPTDLLLSPSVSQLPLTTDSVDGNSGSADFPRRPASFANLLSCVEPSDPPRGAPGTRLRYDTLPTRLTQLPLPVLEPTSKFSASSGDSISQLASFSTRPLRFKDRARTFSQASTSGLKTFGDRMRSKTPSKMNLRRKPSLAGLFRDPNGSGSADGSFEQSRESTTERSRSISRSSSQLPVLGHRQNASVSSSAPSTDSDLKRKVSSRLGFFRNPLRDSTNTSSSGSRPRSSGTISPSTISRPLSASTTSQTSDKRLSDITNSSESSSGSGKGTFAWASRIGRTIKGKNVAAKRALFEGKTEKSASPVLQLAEKVAVGSPPHQSTYNRPPSRIPVSALFSTTSTTIAPPRPRRPSTGLISSDDTTFYGHRVPHVKDKIAEFDVRTQLKSSASRVRAKSSIPTAKARSSRPPQSTQSRVDETANPITHCSTISPASSQLLPPLEVFSGHSLPSRKLSVDQLERDLFNHRDYSSLRPDSLSPPSPSTSDDSPRCPSPSRSFRCPSPARFRDLVPSGSASSPERNERGLPMPSRNGQTRPDSMGSPKKCAMGPEAIICMADAREQTGPITEVRGATTDLADLLSALEETQDYDKSRDHTVSNDHNAPPLPTPPRQYLPHIESIESLRSTVSDVPDDLKELINAVDDHISEVDIPSFVVDGQGMGAFADEGYDPNSSSGSSDSDTDDYDHLSAAFGTSNDYLTVANDRTGGFSSDGATSTIGFDYTASSFEGHVSTAADVLRDMLGGGIPPRLAPPLAPLTDLPEEETIEEESEGEQSEEDEARNSLRDSVRDALAVERPSAGDRMFDRVDFEVSLTALVNGPSLPPSPETSRQTVSVVTASFARGHFRHESVLTTSEGSSDGTTFSILNSPTPLPTSGRPPTRQSLARYSQDRHPMNRPSHRARPIPDQSSGSSEHDHLQSDPTSLSLAQSSRSTNLSISSVTSSPCPARHRRVPMLTRQGLPTLQPSFRFPPEDDNVATVKAEPDVRLRIALQPFEEEQHCDEQQPSTDADRRAVLLSTSPRFVRPLKPSRRGESIPQPRLLELDDLDSLVPPDTPPPSSPSVSDGERKTISRNSTRSIEEDSSRLEEFRSKSHRRQVSASSSILQSTIFEEDNEDGVVSFGSTNVEPSRSAPLSPIFEPPSPAPISSSLPLYDDNNYLDTLPDTQEYDVKEAYDDLVASEDDFDFTAYGDPEVTRKYVHLTYEAETEIRRSNSLWPDTDASREAVALFDAPKTYYAILDFLFASQNRFPSPPHLVRLPSFVPVSFADSPTPPSPVRIPSPLHDSDIDFSSSTPPSPDQIPLYVVEKPVPQPVRVARRPLGAKSINNARVDVLSKSTSSPKKEDVLSPFTALPPRLGTKLRGLRAKISPVKKKVVDTTFLGDANSRRRQTQFNAAARSLEGFGHPSDQRSDEDTDDTGVLEAKGEATDHEITFSRTPRLTTTRPKVRRKTGISSLR